jgi:hypothetical protein
MYDQAYDSVAYHALFLGQGISWGGGAAGGGRRGVYNDPPQIHYLHQCFS